MAVKLMLCVVSAALLSCGLCADVVPLVLWHGMGESRPESVYFKRGRWLVLVVFVERVRGRVFGSGNLYVLFAQCVIKPSIPLSLSLSPSPSLCVSLLLSSPFFSYSVHLSLSRR